MSFNEAVKSKIDIVRNDIGLDEARAVGGSALILLGVVEGVKALDTEPAFAQPAIERVVAVDYNDINSVSRLTYSSESGFAIVEEDPTSAPTPSPTPSEMPLPTPEPSPEAPIAPAPVAEDSAMTALELDEYCGEQVVNQPLTAKMESNKKPGSNKITKVSYIIKLSGVGIDQQCVDNGSVKVGVSGNAEGVNGRTFIVNKWTKEKTPLKKGQYMPMTGNKPPLAPNSATAQTIKVKPTKLVKGPIANKAGELICAPGDVERKTNLEVWLTYQEKDGLYKKQHHGRQIQSQGQKFKGLRKGRSC